MKKISGMALAFAAALALSACGDDSSSSGPDNGGNGNGGANVKKQQALEQAAEMQAAVAQAIATGDYSSLAQYGIDEECAQDTVCLQGKIAESLDAIGIPGLSGECMLDADCFSAWQDSLAASVSWAFSGNADYDNGCSYDGAGMVCQEVLWNSSDSAAARQGASECAALQSGYAAQYGEVSVGPCSKKKSKCTISSHKDARLALFEAEYGTSDLACQDVDDDEGGEGGEGGNTTPMKNGAYAHLDGVSNCTEVYDDPDYVTTVWVGMLGYTAGKCDSKYSVACDLDVSGDGATTQTKLTPDSPIGCGVYSEGDDGDDDDEYAWGYTEMDGGACYEVHTLASQVGAGGVFQAGQCPSKYSVACELEGDPEESSEQYKLTTSSSYTCAMLAGDE